MTLQIVPLDVPLVHDEHGRIQVRGHRIFLEYIAWCVRNGDTVEWIHEGYPSIPLSELHAILAYIHANRSEVDAYLDRRRLEDEEFRTYWEAKFDELHRQRRAAADGVHE
jgi:uncharacterized protein (DUF433 family)